MDVLVNPKRERATRIKPDPIDPRVERSPHKTGDDPEGCAGPRHDACRYDQWNEGAHTFLD